MNATAAIHRGAATRRALTVGGALAALLLAAPFAAHAAEGGQYEVEFAGDRTVEGEHVHVVESGDYLSTIAAAYGLDEDSGWKVLFDANDDVEHPDVIFAGDEITIPEEGEELEARPLPDAAPASAGADAGSAGESSDSGGSAASDSSAGSESGSGGADRGTSVGAGLWDRLAECESNGDWSINTGNGYFGGLQFDKSSWDWAGGRQYAGLPHQATRAQQIAVAERLLEIHPAGWGAWPACASKLGLR